MFPHELGDPPVSPRRFLHSLKSFANASRRFASLLYTPEGKVITQRVWDETLAELDFAGVRDILDSMRAAI